MTRSPSRRTTRRSVPCVAGCCGPMLRIMSPVSSSTFICESARCRYSVGSTSNSGSSPGCGRSVGVVVMPDAPPSSPPPSAPASIAAVSSSGVASPGIGSTSTSPGHGFTSRASNGKSLRKRMAFELGREVQVAEAGMAVEDDAEHLPCLALVPVCAGVDGHPRLRVRVRFVDVDLQRDPRPGLMRGFDVREDLQAPGRSADAEGHLLGLHRRRGVAGSFFRDDRRRHPVDGGDEREVVAAELLLAEARGLSPRSRRDPNDQAAERGAVFEEAVAQLLLEAREHPLLAVRERGRLLALRRSRGRVSQRRSAPGWSRRPLAPW